MALTSGRCPPKSLPSPRRSGEKVPKADEGHLTEAAGQRAPHPAFGHLLPRCGEGEGRVLWVRRPRVKAIGMTPWMTPWLNNLE